MAGQQSPAEFMIYSATKLTSFKGGQPIQTGTGFFYRSNVHDDQYAVLLITNRHVIEGMDEVQFTIHEAQDGGPSDRTVTMMAQLDQRYIAYHPTADLCALNISTHFDMADKQGHPVFISTLQATDIPLTSGWEDLDAIETITMVGCPNGLYDQVNALPITRTGNTATHPGKKYGGGNEFLVDMACFPGSSGSPIFLYDRGSRWNKAQGNYELGPVKFALLGILYSGPTITTEGVIKMVKKPTVEISTMMHLGVAIRSTEIFVVEDVFRAIVASTKTK